MKIWRNNVSGGDTKETVLPEGCEDWNEQEVILNFLDKEKFVHNKISLDIKDGTGEYTML